MGGDGCPKAGVGKGPAGSLSELRAGTGGVSRVPSRRSLASLFGNSGRAEAESGKGPPSGGMEGSAERGLGAPAALLCTASLFFGEGGLVLLPPSSPQVPPQGCWGAFVPLKLPPSPRINFTRTLGSSFAGGSSLSGDETLPGVIITRVIFLFLFYFIFYNSPVFCFKTLKPLPLSRAGSPRNNFSSSLQSSWREVRKHAPLGN